MTPLEYLGAYGGVLAVLFLLRKLLGTFLSVTLFTVATFAWLRVGFDPPVPASVYTLYVLVSLCALLLYVTSSEAAREEFFRPIVAVMTQNRFLPVLIIALLGIPTLVAWQSYQASLPSATAPPKIRSVHPSPPSTITTTPMGVVDPITIDLKTANNPLRDIEASDPELFREKVQLGKDVYYQNCYYCHGDHLMADGHYAKALKPPPANFQDPGTIAMLQESYIFWRVAKGGPGLPNEGTPWDSSMPVWEKMLTEEEMWAVIAFMYDHTGYAPRGNVDLEGGH